MKLLRTQYIHKVIKCSVQSLVKNIFVNDRDSRGFTLQLGKRKYKKKTKVVIPFGFHFTKFYEVSMKYEVISESSVLMLLAFYPALGFFPSNDTRF